MLRKLIIYAELVRREINLEPIYTFLTEDIHPKEFAKLLDEFMYNYMVMLIQLREDDRIGIHEDALEFMHYL